MLLESTAQGDSASQSHLDRMITNQRSQAMLELIYSMQLKSSCIIYYIYYVDSYMFLYISGTYLIVRFCKFLY